MPAGSASRHPLAAARAALCEYTGKLYTRSQQWWISGETAGGPKIDQDFAVERELRKTGLFYWIERRDETVKPAAPLQKS